MAARLLLVDRDIHLCRFLQLIMTKRGFHVEVAHDASSGLRKAYALRADLVILDIMMPDLDGWQLCSRLRDMCDVPIIMLTAPGSPDYVVQGLELGADAYLVKPVAVEELVARVRALLRRASGTNVYRRHLAPEMRYDQLMIDYSERRVSIDGRPVSLSPLEFRLLTVLAKHPGRMLPHSYLLREVWGPEYSGQINTLRGYIRSLRQKIEANPSQPSLITSEWGIGYRFG
jgi:two-component system KDP operon response regulator KdpE